MRVALLTREFLPETRWGGIGTFYADLARSLVEAGAEVEVFTQSLDHPKQLSSDGILVHSCAPRSYLAGPRKGGALAGMAPAALGVFAASLALEITRCFERRQAELPFEIVESHEHLGVGSLLRGGRDRPLRLVRYHTAYDLLVSKGLEPWPRSRFIRFLEARALRASDARIAPSRFIEEATRRHFPGTPQADEVIPLACRFAVVEPQHLSGKEPLVAFVGRLQDRKQPLVAAGAFRRIAARNPAWRFAVAGADGTCADGTSVQQACREILGPFARRTEFLGPLDEEGLAQLFARSSICLVPSTFESFGLVALEAMSFGCVPIVSAGHGLEEIVGEAGCTAPVGDVEAFAAHLERLVLNPTERSERARRALDRVRKTYDSKTILRRNLAVFERLARKGRD